MTDLRPPSPFIEAPPHAPPTRRRVSRVLAVALALAALALAAVLVARRDGGAPALAADRVVVAPLADRTGDSTLAALGVVAGDQVTQGLARAGGRQVVPFPASLSAARIGTAAEPDPVQRLALETGAGLVVTGDYALQGDSLVLRAAVTDARHHRALATLPPVTVPRDRPMAGVAALRRAVTAALVADTMKGAAAPSEHLPSYDAYAVYAGGLSRAAAHDAPAALAAFREAAAADTGWAAPLLMATAACGATGELRAMERFARRAAALRDQLTPYDAALLDALEATTRGDRAAAYAAARRAAALAPGTIAHARVGTEALALGRPREAVRVLDSLDPARGELRGHLGYWQDLTMALHQLGEHTEELYAGSRARALHPASPAARVLELRALAALGQCHRVRARLEDGTDTLASPDVMALARECTAHGDSLVGATLAARALDLARGTVRAQPTARTALELLEALAGAGRWREAAALADSLLAMVPDDTDLRGRRGVVAVRLGDTTQARLADAWLARPALPDGGRAAHWRARIAAASGDETGAIALLQRAAQEGMSLGAAFHADPDLLPARRGPRFIDWMRPKD